MNEFTLMKWLLLPHGALPVYFKNLYNDARCFDKTLMGTQYLNKENPLSISFAKKKYIRVSNSVTSWRVEMSQVFTTNT